MYLRAKIMHLFNFKPWLLVIYLHFTLTLSAALWANGRVEACIRTEACHEKPEVKTLEHCFFNIKIQKYDLLKIKVVSNL